MVIGKVKTAYFIAEGQDFGITLCFQSEYIPTDLEYFKVNKISFQLYSVSTIEGTNLLNIKINTHEYNTKIDLMAFIGSDVHNIDDKSQKKASKNARPNI